MMQQVLFTLVELEQLADRAHIAVSSQEPVDPLVMTRLLRGTTLLGLAAMDGRIEEHQRGRAKIVIEAIHRIANRRLEQESISN